MVIVRGASSAFKAFHEEEGEDVDPGEFLLGEDNEILSFELDKLRKYGFSEVQVDGRRISL